MSTSMNALGLGSPVGISGGSLSRRSRRGLDERLETRHPMETPTHQPALASLSCCTHTHNFCWCEIPAWPSSRLHKCAKPVAHPKYWPVKEGTQTPRARPAEIEEGTIPSQAEGTGGSRSPAQLHTLLTCDLELFPRSPSGVT